jgi:hypothetical protein
MIYAGKTATQYLTAFISIIMAVCRPPLPRSADYKKEDMKMFKFSPYGIKDSNLWQMIYGDFIEWCKTQVTAGTFSTYCNGEPVCMCCGFELSYRMYLNAMETAL